MDFSFYEMLGYAVAILVGCLVIIGLLETSAFEAIRSAVSGVI